MAIVQLMNKPLRFLLIANSINILADNLFVPIYALFITKLGGGPQLAGILFAIRFLSIAVFVLLIQRFRDKVNLDSQMLQVCFLIKTIAWTFLAFNQSIPALVIAQIAFGLSGAIGAPAFNSLVSENLDKKRHIHDWGIWELMQNLAIAVAAALSGFIMVSFGFSFLFILMATLEFISLLVYRSTHTK